MLHYLETVVLELLRLRLLLLQRRRQRTTLHSQASLAHSEVLRDQAQVLVDSFEVFHLLVHAVSILVKVPYFLITWANGVLELFDLVIKHELEFLELLGLFSQGVDVVLLLLDALITLLKFLLLLKDLRLQVLALSNQLLQGLVSLCDLALQFKFGVSCRLKLTLHFSQLGLRLHASIDDFAEVFLVFLFDDVDLVPSFIFDLLSFLLVFFDHLLEFFLEVLELLVFFLLLVLVLLLHLLALLFLPGALLGDHVLELLDLSELKLVELLVLLVILLLLLLKFDFLLVHVVHVRPLQVL